MAMETEENAPTWRKVFKLLHYVAALLYVVAAGALVAILHASEWHHHLLRFLYRTWVGFLVHLGSTPSGFISPIIVSVLSIAGALLCIGYLYGRAAMKKHFWETAAITSVVFATVMLLVYGTQLAWEVARSGDAALVGRLPKSGKGRNSPRSDNEPRRRGCALRMILCASQKTHATKSTSK